MRERGGRSLPFIVRNKGEVVPSVRDHVGALATIHADEGNGWDALRAGRDMKRINHSIAPLNEGVCTNQAESYFSRFRRMKAGTHHHIAGSYINAFAGEASWREDNRRVSNGTQAATVASAAMASAVSRKWAGVLAAGCLKRTQFGPLGNRLVAHTTRLVLRNLSRAFKSVRRRRGRMLSKKNRVGGPVGLPAGLTLCPRPEQ